MCGIVGYVGKRPALDILLPGLKRLEYRGYDSAGVAYFRDQKIEIKKAEGKLENVVKLLSPGTAEYASVHVGIGHTRWATHGKPSTQNAHPHRCDHIVLVHNGIIENYQEIKKNLATRGHKPVSETDSELFGFLVLEEMAEGHSLVEGVRRAFAQLEGQCSIVIMSEKEPGKIIGVRNGSPLVVAVDPQGGVIFASDAQPILETSQDVVFLENGDVAIGTLEGLEIVDLKTGTKVTREKTHLTWSVEKMDKQGFPHYMLKEIHEQPVAIIDTLNALLDRAKTDPFPFIDQRGVKLVENCSEIIFVACGTSWHAALVGKYWLERWAKIPCQVELASEFRYRNPVLLKGAVVIGISQSGETADTLAVIRDVKKIGNAAIGITNVRGSTLSREADAIFYTSAGPEIGVAATKTFLAQMLSVFLLAGFLAKKRQGDTKEIVVLFDGMIKLPQVLTSALGQGSPMLEEIKNAAGKLFGSKGFFFIGRGYSFPIALEGALKLKEIAYVHAEGYAAGELKHGPIAMIDKDMTVVVLAPKDQWRDKTASNLEEVKARGARILGIGDASDSALKSLCDEWISLPKETSTLDSSLHPFLLTPIIQLLSYELALLAGTDVDKPRNLAKSVTVE